MNNLVERLQKGEPIPKDYRYKFFSIKQRNMSLFMKDSKSEILNKILTQDFGISGIIYDGALKIAKEARDKGND